MLQHALVAGLIAVPACQAASHDSTPSVAASSAKDSSAVAAADDAPKTTITGRGLAAGSALDRLPDVAEKAVQSVVNIATEKTVALDPRQSPFDNPFFRDFFGGRLPEQPSERRQEGRGSGVIVSDDGLVLTNNHVVGGADEIHVTLSDGREYDAAVVGTDERSDLAVVRIEEPPSDLVPIEYGDSSKLRLGEVVLAIGNPFGIGQTVTMGIVSATGRANLGIVSYEDFIQTDAAINPGNSGGALVNLDGELVGINTAIISGSGGYQGVGFAIPTHMAQRIASDLVGDGRVSRGYLGVAIQDLDEDLQTALGLDNVSGGVLIADVTVDSAAEAAGFRRGDVVVEFNGEEVRDATTFRLSVADAGAGESFKAVVLRDGKRKTLKGELGELDAPSDDSGDDAPAEAGDASLGLSVTPLTPELRDRLELPPRVRSGVVIQTVEPGSAAARAGLRRGDVVLEVNRQGVSDAGDVRAALKRDEDRALLLVLRGRSTQYLVLPR